MVTKEDIGEQVVISILDNGKLRDIPGLLVEIKRMGPHKYGYVETPDGQTFSGFTHWINRIS